MTQNKVPPIENSPIQYAIGFLWDYFEARGQWPSRKAFLLHLDSAGLSKDALQGAPELSLNAGSGDEVRPSFTTLVSLPAVRELLIPVPAVFRHAARVFAEQALVVPENFLPSVHFHDVQGYWGDASRARKALQILRGLGGFFIGGHASGTDLDDFSFSVTIDALRYDHVETLDEVLELPRYPEVRNAGPNPTGSHLELMRRIYLASKAEQRWPRALAFAIESREIGFIPQLVNELRYEFIKAEYSPSQHHSLVLTERALPLIDPSGEDQHLFVKAIRSIVGLWRARDGNGDILLAEVAASVGVSPATLGPIVAFLDSAKWCHAAHRTEWTHSGLVIVPGEPELILRNKDVTSFAGYLERWDEERVRTSPEIWTGSAGALLGKEGAVTMPNSEPRASSPEPEPADTASAPTASPRAVSDSRFRYDVAISFAGPQRPQAEELAHSIREAGYEVFYDRFYAPALWGKNLATLFDDVFRKQARFCVPFVSRDYATRVWTTREFQSALARAVDERGGEYLLPVLVEAVEIPGLLPTIGHVSLVDHTIADVAELLKEKLKSK
jgi:hypothetical protein